MAKFAYVWVSATVQTGTAGTVQPHNGAGETNGRRF